MPPENEHKFDEMLKKNLKQHSEPIRQNFAAELIAKIQKLEQQEILNRIVMQERALLAACILLPIAAIAVMFAFPNLISESAEQIAKLKPILKQSFVEQWQYWTSYVFAAAAGLYAIYEMLIANN
jgi:hypothetical protein